VTTTIAVNKTLEDARHLPPRNAQVHRAFLEGWTVCLFCPDESNEKRGVEPATDVKARVVHRTFVGIKQTLFVD
jgi:hypothetical protein